VNNARRMQRSYMRVIGPARFSSSAAES